MLMEEYDNLKYTYFMLYPWFKLTDYLGKINFRLSITKH